ncbi:MAG: aldehyde ferredoxin oxidoreductase family protein [Proteobacteria bacterium]|nr:aldehyde ferredoxin oxidoreductase family protein [Pseudomonadota bacterium]
MKDIHGTSNRILEINLTEKKSYTFIVEDEDRRKYLGGKGLGLKYLSERMAPGTPPLGEENYLVFMMGVLMGTSAPCSGRFAALTKSPLTGIMLTSSCGGPFGMAYKTAGFDGLLITGKSEKPMYLTIDENQVKFMDASHLWGKDTDETQDLLGLDKNESALVIGPAGENKVLFANIASGHRFLGRGGMGAVMGSKNLKAIVAKGKTHKIIPHDPEKLQKIVKRANKYIKNNHFVGGLYKNYGTSANVTICNTGGILPVNNFQAGSHPDAPQVSGETMAEKYPSKPSTCKPCSIGCGHKGRHPDGSMHQIPEYETVGLLGTNLGIFDAGRITEWNDLCGKMGMDTISTGSVIGWAMEAGEKGLFESDLTFGNPEGIAETISRIANKQGIGKDLGQGTRRLAEKFGGLDFAIQVKGLEMAAYDPRGSWGQGLAYAVANRGACHLSATTMALEVFMGYLNPHTDRAKADFVKYFENMFAMVNSLHTCQFAAFAYILEPPIVKYTPKPLLGLTMQYLPHIALQLIFINVLTGLYSSVTGIKMPQKDLLKAGERIHVLERYMNTREGISRKDDNLPDRMLKENRVNHLDKKPIPLEKMIDAYYKKRGYDKNGIPSPKTLKKLGISLDELPVAIRKTEFETITG